MYMYIYVCIYVYRLYTYIHIYIYVYRLYTLYMYNNPTHIIIRSSGYLAVENLYLAVENLYMDIENPHVDPENLYVRYIWRGLYPPHPPRCLRCASSWCKGLLNTGRARPAPAKRAFPTTWQAKCAFKSLR